MTGIAALIYFVGAVIMWIRLKSVGLAPDVALEHMSQIQLVVLGVKASVIVLAVLALLFGPVRLYLGRRAWHRARAAEAPAPAVEGGFLSRLRQPAPGMIVEALVLVGLALLAVVFSFLSWRWFGVSFALIIGTAAVLVYDARYFSHEKNPNGVLVLALALAVAVAAVTWQLPSSFSIQGALVSPPPTEASRDIALPYFGEAGGYVYVPEVYRAEKQSDGSWRFWRTGKILALKREGLGLRFPGASTTMDPNPRKPATIAKVLFWRFVHAFRE